MNCNYLVANGTYSRDMLTKEQRNFIEGMEYALQEVETCINSYYNEDDVENTLDKIKREIARAALFDIKDYIKNSVNEVIVALVDRNEEEAEKSEEYNVGNVIEDIEREMFNRVAQKEAEKDK